MSKASETTSVGNQGAPDRIVELFCCSESRLEVDNMGVVLTRKRFLCCGRCCPIRSTKVLVPREAINKVRLLLVCFFYLLHARSWTDALASYLFHH